MKIREIKNTGVWSNIRKYRGRKNGVVYEIIEYSDYFYILAHDLKKDLTFNSLWIEKNIKLLTMH